ncbi:ABC transporter ATP-binding protein [Exiguobacterium sp.]|uniref:ABC transporter ATP-binding protein n=1 Tax=Exiguobacterium sp. TaxID=44751 RepID=UPI003918850C
MEEAVLALNHVSKAIKGKTIIDDISMEVYPGEVFGFLGPNGAGKTTTIRMIVGLTRPSMGSIHIDGSDVHQKFEAAIRRVGAIIENPELYTYLTGYQNLKHFARMSDLKISENKISEIVRVVGLKDRIDEKVKLYSLGMKQRLGLAQALLHEPKLLILDEPTNGLDPAGIRELRGYLRRIAKEKRLAIFVSSHLLGEMQLLCDRIGIIRQGKLLRTEAIEDLLSTKQSAYQYVLAVEPVDEAIRILRTEHPDVRIEQGQIRLTLSRDQIPYIVRQLVSEQINIYQLEETKRTLEETFLEMTEVSR